MTDYLDNFDKCIEGTIPYCGGACPFNMEILNFMEKARRGSAKAAFNVYRNAVGYPRIVSRICPGRCLDVCPCKEHGGSVNLPELEKATLALTKDTAPTDYNIPAKKERIAIIGAGAAGIGALLRLSTKKYHVEVFEKSNVIGGWLREAIEPEIVEADFNEQLQFQDYEIHFNTEISDPSQLKGMDFNAVIAATGDGGADFGLLDAVSDKGDRYCCEIDGAGWFAVGGLIGSELIDSVAAGLYIGTTVDNYIKTGHQYYPNGNFTTALCEGMVTIDEDTPAIEPAGDAYTKEEFAAEASRCVECRCSYCRKHCDLCEYANKWPLRIKDEVIATTLEGKTELKATPARRLMSLCNQCGLCSEVCPENIDMDTLFMVGRQKMFRQGKMPWAFHDFYRRDMEQANGEASLVRIPLNEETGEEFDSCEYAFFPGCQLGAAEPEIVVKVYDCLRFQHPDTAMFLQCCGIAAEWEGDVDGFNEVLSDICSKWERLGRPTMVMACMTCYKKFRENLPEIPVVSLYELLLEMNVSGGCNSVDYSIFNPCSARHEDKVRDAVAELAEGMGVKLHPLPENEQYAKCCGYGGHGDIADKGYSDFVAQRRIAESEYPYITYCINCRDMFKTHGKDAVHILELIFGMGDSNVHMIHEHDHDGVDVQSAQDPENCDGNCAACSSDCGAADDSPLTPAPLPTISERWQNRLELKQMLLELFWGEEMEITDKMLGLTLFMSDEIRDKLNRKHIFEHEIAEVIEFCQRTSRTVLNTGNGTLTGYKQIGNMTYWVEYKQVAQSRTFFEVVNAYSHRLQIELEAVWNGIRKADEI